MLMSIRANAKRFYQSQPLLCNRLLAIGAGFAANYGINLDLEVILPLLIGVEFVGSWASVYSPATVKRREEALTAPGKPWGRFTLTPDTDPR